MAAKQQQLTQEMVIECVRQLAKTVEHNQSYLQGVHKGIENSGYNSMGHMFGMIMS